MLSLRPFYRWGTGSERLGDSPRVTQLRRKGRLELELWSDPRAGLWAQLSLGSYEGCWGRTQRGCLGRDWIPKDLCLVSFILQAMGMLWKLKTLFSNVSLSVSENPSDGKNVHKGAGLSNRWEDWRRKTSLWNWFDSLFLPGPLLRCLSRPKIDT